MCVKNKNPAYYIRENENRADHQHGVCYLNWRSCLPGLLRSTWKRQAGKWHFHFVLDLAAVASVQAGIPILRKGLGRVGV